MIIACETAESELVTAVVSSHVVRWSSAIDLKLLMVLQVLFQ